MLRTSKSYMDGCFNFCLAYPDAYGLFSNTRLLPDFCPSINFKTPVTGVALESHQTRQRSLVLMYNRFPLCRIPLPPLLPPPRPELCVRWSCYKEQTGRQVFLMSLLAKSPLPGDARGGDAAHLQRMLLVLLVVALPAAVAQARLPRVGRAHGAGGRLFELLRGRRRRCCCRAGEVGGRQVDLCWGLGARGRHFCVYVYVCVYVCLSEDVGLGSAKLCGCVLVGRWFHAGVVMCASTTMVVVARSLAMFREASLSAGEPLCVSVMLLPN